MDNNRCIWAVRRSAISSSPIHAQETNFEGDQDKRGQAFKVAVGIEIFRQKRRLYILIS